MNGKISLDTNIVIRLFKNDPLVTKRLTILSTIYLPTPVIAELTIRVKEKGASHS